MYFAWRVSSLHANILIVFPMNAAYSGVYFHLRISCEIVNCWECAWDAVGWEGPLHFAGEEHGGGQEPSWASTRSLNCRVIGPFPTHPGLPVLALQLCPVIYFRSIPAGGDK